MAFILKIETDSKLEFPMLGHAAHIIPAVLDIAIIVAMLNV